ncbi:Cobalamin synthase [Chitinispirillum alkaliphilum]|nr:Cobalamin synthase [Chitinispirillum alkaliphilum]
MISKGFITALRLLTVIPIRGRETDHKYSALPYFVFVGAVIGLLQYFFAQGIALYAAGLTFVAGLLIAMVNYVVTGGLHLDGLADTADAFGTIHSPEKTLSILKDPHIGTFGVGAIVISVLWRVAAYQQLFQTGLTLWIVFAISYSRIMQGFFLLLFPYARGKEGKAFGFKGPARITVYLALQVLIVSVAVVVFENHFILYWALPVGVIGTVSVCFLYMKRLGGLTGDCIGAATELFELFFLTAVLASGQA